MTPDYQFFHGAVLHEIIIGAGREIKIALRHFSGRPDAFVIEGRIGLLIKHSSARITPWQFTFTKDQLTELHALRLETSVCFVALVCGKDGFVCIRDVNLIEILTPTDGDLISVRVERRPRKQYGVSSSGNSLNEKLAKGAQEIISELMCPNSNNAPTVDSLPDCTFLAASDRPA
jgi:hypothetical protein